MSKSGDCVRLRPRTPRRFAQNRELLGGRQRSEAKPPLYFRLPHLFLWTCRLRHVRLTRFVLVASVSRQELLVFQSREIHAKASDYYLGRRFMTSTSRF